MVVHPLSRNIRKKADHTVTGIDPRHRPHHLSLLPSGSDEVRDRLLRGGRSDGQPKLEIKPLSGNSAPHKADFGNRAPLAPRLAQPVDRIKHYNYFSSKKSARVNIAGIRQSVFFIDLTGVVT